MMADDNEIIVHGKFVKIAQFREEWDVDVDDPEHIIEQIKTNGIKADIFTFIQRLPESKPKFNYYMEWDSVAAIPVKSYEYWLNSRKKIGLAKRKNVEVRVCDFNDDFVRSQLQIYNETPVRQLKPNRAFGTTFDKAKKANLTFLDRAVFLGAYFDNELIGFLKLVDTHKFVRTMGIIGKVSHRDKAPMNLLVAKAVEICAEKKTPYLTYAKFDYGKLGADSFKEFKKNLGFENIIHPRYFIALTAWGKLILRLKLHNRFIEVLPLTLIRFFLFMRDLWYKRKYAAYLKNS
jgi:hypothetical protein